jgi:hypothetical protein
MNAANLSAVLLGGSIAGALDIIFAISFAAYNGATPVRLLQTVASGLLGTAAVTGGVRAALGLGLHLVMSILRAGAFLLLATFAPALTLHPLGSGIVFGAFVFLAMRRIVLPPSAFPYPITFKPFATALDLPSHTLLFDVPIAWPIQKALRNVPAKA